MIKVEIVERKCLIFVLSEVLSRAFDQELDFTLDFMHKTQSLRRCRGQKSRKSSESRERLVTLHSAMLEIAGFLSSTVQ